MDLIKEIFKIIAEGVDIIGILILLFGFLKLLIKYLKIEFNNKFLESSIEKIQSLRCELGVYILLSLDFLIASDIIHTIMDINTEKLIELTIMIVLRTGIGYFLGKEIDEIHRKE